MRLKTLSILMGLTALGMQGQSLPARRSSNYDASTRDGRFDLRVRVDGRCEFYIRGSEIRYRVRSGQDPVDAGSEYRKEIPRGELIGLNVEKRDGRGSIRVLEEPSRRNNYTLILEIDDREGGSARYHARITWEDARDFENPFERGGRSWRSNSGSRSSSRTATDSRGTIGERFSQVDERSSGSGDLDFRGSRDALRSAEVRFETNGDADILLETSSDRAFRFRGRLRSQSSTSATVELEDSDLGRASGTATISFDSRGRISYISMSGRIDRDSFYASFRR